jgi:peptidoglycan/LPS O-acetylase OafA/YrhL
MSAELLATAAVPSAGRSTRSLREILTLPHLPALDGLRAAAVLTVIVGHANYPVRGVPSDLGVSAFFVLSGFLITRLLIAEHDATASISLFRFYLRRTLRIFPAYYAFLLLSLVLDSVQGQRWTPALLGSALTYSVNYFNAFHHHPPTSIAHAWSLAVEEQFYLLWPIAFLLLRARGRRMVAVGVVITAVVVATWRSWLALGAEVDTSYLYNAFDTRFDNLAVGCLLAVLLEHEGFIAVAEASAKRVWSPLIPLALMISSRTLLPEAYHYSVGFTVDAILAAIIMLQLVQLSSRWMWSWLDHLVLRFIGVISYPMYLYHAWGASVGRHVMTTEGGRFWTGLAATIALACGSYFIIERPLLALRHQLGASAKRARVTPSSHVPTALRRTQGLPLT